MATKYLRGDSWCIQWYDQRTKKQSRLTIGVVSEAVAERARKIKELELAAGVQLAVAGGEPRDNKTFAAFWREDYAPWHGTQYPASRSKLRMCGLYILPRLGAERLSDITVRSIEMWKAALIRSTIKVGKEVRPIAPESVRTIYSQLRAALHQAVLWGEIKTDPMKGVKPPPPGNATVPRMLSAEELSAIYAESQQRASWWKFMANTGLRRAEAMKAKRSDIKQGASGALTLAVESNITSGGRTKSGKVRVIPLNQSAVAALADLGADRLFPTMAPRVFSRHFEMAAKRAGVDASIHDLRHSFASHLAHAGVPVVTIRDLMGHASITTTMIYMHHAPHTSALAVETVSL